MKMFEKNNEAVSPVIGVILMVAITVILAAVIASFVFGMTGSQAKAPTAQLTGVINSNNYVNITHSGGEDITLADVTITVLNGTSNNLEKLTFAATDAAGKFIEQGTAVDGILSPGERLLLQTSGNETIDIIGAVFIRDGSGISYTISVIDTPSGGMISQPKIKA